MAREQQNLDREISAKRGVIYDRNGEILAMSASSEMITINPNNIPKEKKELVARKISEVLEIDYEKILKKVNRNSSIEIIGKKIEKEKSNISNLNYEERIDYYKNSSKIQIKDVNITDKIIKLSTCSYLNSKTSPTDQRYYIIATLNKIN